MIIIGHELPDMDCLAAILELLQVGEEKIAGISGAEIWFWNRNETEFEEKMRQVPEEELVIFVDVHPPKSLDRKNVMVFDHHNTEDELKQITATQKVCEYLELLGNERIQRLVKWTQRSDYGGSIFPISLPNCIKKLHLVETEDEVMQWTAAALESFLSVSDEGLKFDEASFGPALQRFKEIVREFPGNNIFKEWQESKLATFSDPISIPRIFGFISEIQGEEIAEKWLRQGLAGIQKDQEDFQRAVEDYEDPTKTTKIKIGDAFVIIGVSDSQAFARAARKRGEKELGTIALVTQISQDSFQLYANPQLQLDEVVGALRAEILTRRGLPVPRDWRELKSPGELPGTEPLYYRQAENDFIGWGSLTASGVESWKTVFQSSEEIRAIVFCAVDQKWLPACCPGHRCLGTECQVFQWKLKRCYEIQRNSRGRGPSRQK